MNTEAIIQRDREYSEISYYRNLGMRYEKEGEYCNALDAYLESIRRGEASGFDMLHAYRYCYDRAIALSYLSSIHWLESELREGLSRHIESSKAISA